MEATSGAADVSKTKSTTSDARLAALRSRTKRATCFVTFFLVFLFLIMAALIAYLVLDITSESMEETTSLHSSSIINSDSGLNSSNSTNHTLTFVDFLQTASLQLQNATSFLKSVPGLKNCSDHVNGALVEIQYAIAEMSDPMMRRRIWTSEWSLNECRNDLRKMELESVMLREAKAKVLEAWERVRKCGDLAEELRSGKDYWGEKNEWEWMGEVWNSKNLFLCVIGAIEIAFIGFMLHFVCCR